MDSLFVELRKIFDIEKAIDEPEFFSETFYATRSAAINAARVIRVRVVENDMAG